MMWNKRLIMSKIKLLLLIESLLVFIASACQQESKDWHLLSPVHGYPELAFDRSGSLWIFDETKNTINYVAITDDENNYVLQDIPYPDILTSQNTILDFCASGSVWIVTDDGGLLLYDSQNRTWIKNPLTPGRVRQCESLNSKKLAVVMDENKIGIVDGNNFNLLSDVPGNIRNIYQDDFGNIWVVSESSLENTHIVYKGNNEGNWTEQARDLGGRLLFVQSDSIWTAGDPLVTVFKSSIKTDSGMIGPPLYQIRIDGLLLGVFSDKNENAWIVTNRNVMLKTRNDSQFNIVSLPWSVDRIISSTFNVDQCILYISTDVGVFYSKNNCK
jgi:hypothetical protein